MLHEIEPKKLNITYAPEVPADGDTVLFMRAGEILLAAPEDVAFPTYKAFCDGNFVPENFGEWTYLFRIDDKKYFTLRYDESAFPESPEDLRNRAENAGYRFLRSYSLRGMLPRDEAFAGLLGSQLIGWYGRTRFCGRCGGKLNHDARERMMRCPACGNMVFPQICPSVIVGVLHEGKLLVTRYNPAHKMFDSAGKTFNPTVRDALVAGYIESGETGEQCVEREVREEVGLKVKNIRYYKSTPWPLSGSLLLAYLCDVDGDPTVKVEKDELSQAIWKSPEEIEPIEANDVSLTRGIMDDFRKGLIH